MNRFNIFDNYTPVGDLTVMAICYVMIILMIFSYIRKSRSYKVFVSIVGSIILAAVADVSFYSLASLGRPELYPIAYAMRCAYHALLFAIFVLYVVYITEVTGLEHRRKKIYIGISIALLCAVVAVDVLDTVNGRNLRITGNGVAFQGRDVFIYGYLSFVALIVVLMCQVRNRLYKRVMWGFYGTMAISFLMLMMQGMYGQSSFTVATFLFPVIAMFYIMHSNPYDVRLGAIDSKALEDMVRYSYEKRRDFMFMSLYMKEFEEEGKDFPAELQTTVRRFSTDFFRDSTLFMVSGGHVLLLFSKNHNPDYESRIVKILAAFRYQYLKFGYDYKIVIGNSIDEVSRKNEYISFIRSIHRSMEENSVHRVEAQDVERFTRNEVVLRELADINQKHDLNDPRVLAYCQPVYNVDLGKYDTAESLMRLQLEGTGMVFPDQFIPLAEENGYIHVLTQIILHKTCEAVKQLLSQGYEVSRVSVNVSPIELKDDSFCQDIIDIIDASGLPGEKIAIELTESRNESDFLLMKNKISVLKQRGIKFYLDDFGTGYSSMERIMELPFDIIKFDRSMVIVGGTNVRARKMVESLANMFNGLNYSVLYEGVEDEKDEQMCEGMAASYLQGYKYSRPVPIHTLKDFFERQSA